MCQAPFYYILLLFIVITLALTGCGKKIVNLYFENGEIPVFVFDEFKFEDYTFKLERKNGDIEDVQLTLEMFSQEEIQMFKTIGTHNISLEYEDLVLNFNITIYNSKSSYKVEYYL